MVWGLIIIGGIILADVLVHVLSLRIALPVFENKPPFRVVKTPPDPDAEIISFPTRDGLMLTGSLYRHAEQPVRGLILFCHELGSDHCSAMTYCQGLWDAGFDIMAFDFRNHGESDTLPGYEPLHWLTDYEVNDVMSAIAFVRRQQDLKNVPLGVFGISRGGCAALAAAAICRDIHCVACEGTYSTEGLTMHYAPRWARVWVAERFLNLVPKWHLRLTLRFVRLVSQWKRKCRYTNIETLLPRLRELPLLLITGERDTYVHPDTTRELCRRAGHGEEAIWMVSAAKHNMARQADSEEYDHRLVEFFSVMPMPTIPVPIEQPQA